MSDHSTTFTAGAFAEVAARHPDLHPWKAITKSLGTGANDETPAERLIRLRQKLADKRACGLAHPSTIADLEREIARVEAVVRTDAHFDKAEASLAVVAEGLGLKAVA